MCPSFALQALVVDCIKKPSTGSGTLGFSRDTKQAWVKFEWRDDFDGVYRTREKCESDFDRLEREEDGYKLSLLKCCLGETKVQLTLEQANTKQAFIEQTVVFSRTITKIALSRADYSYSDGRPVEKVPVEKVQGAWGPVCACVGARAHARGGTALTANGGRGLAGTVSHPLVINSAKYEVGDRCPDNANATAAPVDGEALAVCDADFRASYFAFQMQLGYKRLNFGDDFEFFLGNGKLPPGMSLATNNGTVSGRPLVDGTYFAEIWVRPAKITEGESERLRYQSIGDEGLSATYIAAKFNFSIAPRLQQVSGVPLFAAVGFPFESAKVNYAGGVAPYFFSIANDTLDTDAVPAGLVVDNSTGQIVGLPCR